MRERLISRYVRYELGRRRVVMRTKMVPLAAVTQAGLSGELMPWTC